MARGEAPKERPSFSGAAIGASFLVFCLCALTGVALQTRECRSSAIQPPTPEPFVAAIATFHALSWRDTARVRDGSTPIPDAAGARVAIEGALRTRGYVAAPATGPVALTPLPADFEATAMEGSCGVLVVLADGAATLTRAQVTVDGVAHTYLAHDPSALPVPLCGAQRVRVEGTGAAGAHVWHYPGLTPGTVLATGLDVDVVLAHAEAEVLLRARGLTPTGEVARIEVPAGTGAQPIPLGRTVASGCVPFVAVLVGGGDPAGSWSPIEHISDRGMVGLGLCATRTDTNPLVMVTGGAAAQAYVRPYVAFGEGAPPVVSAAALRLVPLADLTLPAGVLEAPLP